jgi:hypothetical protein
LWDNILVTSSGVQHSTLDLADIKTSVNGGREEYKYRKYKIMSLYKIKNEGFGSGLQ